MQILSIQMKNIKSHRDKEYSFSPGINVLSGPNGIGKSTIFEAVGYALFGVDARDFVGNIDRWHQMIQGPHNHIELAEQILDESGYTEMWQTDKTPEAPGRLENLKELVKALDQFENLQGFLEHVSLIMDNETEESGAKV